MHLVDGNYTMVLATKKTVQREEYSLFIDKLLDAVRNELTWSAEVSYESLSIKEACEILLTTEQDLNWIVQREISNPERNYRWEIKNGRLWFEPLNIDKHSIPSKEMMMRTLDYAIELERIV